MFKTYQSLNHRGKLKRSIELAVFSFFFIIVLFAFTKISREIILIISLVFIVVGAYQIRRDYKNSKIEEEE
ncbi:hypothetical protein B0H99_103147 [Planomicrobium soli]|uniref:Uncharacterized protein n=1 Tax=Planomicrobium soli TaxID=1176648 RepID=A0A2P8H486_9BACL|nr:hypothetical protein B0H99_103147 [Planomicrobium soli]